MESAPAHNAAAPGLVLAADESPAPRSTRGRTLLFGLMACAVGLVVAFAIVEGGLRLLGIGYGHAPLVSDPLLHHAHPRDYRYLSHNPSGEFGGFHVYFDANGMVADPSGRMIYTPTRHRRYIAMLGDSHVEALQVAYDSGMVGRLNARAAPDVFVANYGVSSYSPVLYRLLWEHKVRDAHPAHVFLVLANNDIRDDSGYVSSARVEPGRGVVAVPGPKDQTMVVLLRHSYTVRLLRKVQLTLAWMREHRGASDQQAAAGSLVEENPDVSPLTAEQLLAIDRSVRASGARFTLLAAPSKLESLHPGTLPPGTTFAEKVAAWAHANGVDCIDLAPVFREFVRDHPSASRPLFFTRDIHMTPAGHALVAREIERRYPEYFVSEPGGSDAAARRS